MISHNTTQQGTLLLNRNDILSLLDLGDYLDIVESAFRCHALGETLTLGLLHVDTPDGEFHIKTGGLKQPRTYFGLKLNGGFFQNVARFGMPNIQGTIALCDGDNGYPLALMESIEITIRRTGATTAVAAKYLARKDSSVVTICGCGNQGRVQLSSLALVLPIDRAYAYDSAAETAEGFASEMTQRLGFPVTATSDVASAVGNSDVCVTCSPSREYYLEKEYVPSGMFLASVGADSPEKRELDPRLMEGNTVVVDLLEQCAKVGELHHAISQGYVTCNDVHAELGQILAGQKPGRTSDEEIIIFDATGTGLQDAAGAAAVYQRALEQGRGTFFNFFAS
jgi:ornithine cyclodeaminase/alanine dehydrogenase